VRRLLIGSAIAAGLLLIAGGFAWTRAGGTSSRGPLDYSGAISIGMPVPLGKPYSYAVDLRNTTNRPLTLHRIGLERNNGIQLVGAYVLPLTSPRAIGFVAGFRRLPDGFPLNGYTVAPKATVRIVLGLSLLKTGRYRFKQVRVDYRGRADYHDSFAYSAQLCSPVRQFFHSCHALDSRPPAKS
jgi:hypothetical protein